MQMSDEIIKVLEYLCSKFGLTIDWTSDNVLPYVEQLCEKFIKFEIRTSIAWIAIAIVVTIIALIFLKVVDCMDAFWIVICIAILIIGTQIFDIIECYTFPEKTIYDYIQSQINT